jgi:hypothetical protein
MKLTRRELAAVVSATATGVAAAATTAQTGQGTANPADELQAARDGIKANSDLLARQTVPMATEPAFQFKA